MADRTTSAGVPEGEHRPGTLARRVKDKVAARARMRRQPPPPWRQGNHFRLLNDGREFFPRMLAAIDAAREYVLLEMYLVESGRVMDRFIHALGQAAARGVRVCALFDGFGALGLKPSDRRRLLDAGVQVCWYNALGWRKRLANLIRNHRKLLVVDGRTAFVGGAGLTDEFDDPAPDGRPWREVMVEIEGPVVGDWVSLFSETWRHSGGAPLSVSVADPRTDKRGAEGRVVYSAGWHRSILADSVIEQMENARTRVYVVSAYFVPSRRFRKTLRRAVRRGVDVRVLAPGPVTDHPLVRHAGRRFFGKLLRNGVRIFEYQPRVLHAKLVICDDWVSVGSANLDRWNFKWNLEANQEIRGRAFADAAAAMFERDCADSVELESRAWARRPWSDRLREAWARWVDRLLETWRRPPVR